MATEAYRVVCEVAYVLIDRFYFLIVVLVCVGIKHIICYNASKHSVKLWQHFCIVHKLSSRLLQLA